MTYNASGTLDKCKACDKKVYVVDMVSADGTPYHKTCFKCSHCNGKLVMGRFSCIDGILYCTTHFEQLVREGKIKNHTQAKKQGEQGQSKAASKLSAMFSGTMDKCSVCKKTVYPLEKVTVEGDNFHKSCFRCAKGGCFLSPSNYAALDGIVYCKPHFAQLFKERGSYNSLAKGISVNKAEEGEPSEVADVPNPEEDAPEAEPSDDPKPEE